MKVNPLGISAYTRIDPAKSGATKQERGGVVSESAGQAKADDAMTLKPQNSATESSVAMRASSTLASMISPEERAAIELLFERYADRQASETAYGSGGSSQAAPKLGAKVDFRA